MHPRQLLGHRGACQASLEVLTETAGGEQAQLPLKLCILFIHGASQTIWEEAEFVHIPGKGRRYPNLSVSNSTFPCALVNTG